MRYTYAYKTPDGVRHEATVSAGSREEVFAGLRSRGIRAIKVVAADGSRANGEVRGVRRRVAAAMAALAALAAGSAAYLGGTRTGGAPGSAADSFQTDRTRRQVIGDAAVIEKGLRSGWADVFEQEGERFLASFAVPGARAGQRSTTEGELLLALGRRCEAKPSDTLEARQMKAMVEGMKDEARRYIAAGGTAVGYGRRLTERQDAEIAVYGRVRADIEGARSSMGGDAFMEYWERRNDELRSLGIRTVGLGED